METLEVELPFVLFNSLDPKQPLFYKMISTILKRSLTSREKMVYDGFGDSSTVAPDNVPILPLWLF